LAHELGLIGKPNAVLIMMTVSLSKQLWVPKVKDKVPISNNAADTESSAWFDEQQGLQPKHE
jgi:hypothetical protein